MLQLPEVRSRGEALGKKGAFQPPRDPRIGPHGHQNRDRSPSRKSVPGWQARKPHNLGITTNSLPEARAKPNFGHSYVLDDPRRRYPEIRSRDASARRVSGKQQGGRPWCRKVLHGVSLNSKSRRTPTVRKVKALACDRPASSATSSRLGSSTLRQGSC